MATVIRNTVAGSYMLPALSPLGLELMLLGWALTSLIITVLFHETEES